MAEKEYTEEQLVIIKQVTAVWKKQIKAAFDETTARTLEHFRSDGSNQSFERYYSTALHKALEKCVSHMNADVIEMLKRMT